MTNRKKRDIPNPFGAVLIRIREERGFSGYSLAQASGKAVSQIYGLEKGLHEPKVSTIIWLAEAMGMEPKDLFQEFYLALKSAKNVDS